MKLFVQYTLFSILIFHLSACSSKVQSIKKDVNIDLQSSDGFILLGIETNLNLHGLVIDGPRKITLTQVDLQRGTNYFLLNLPAGHYNIEEINIIYWSDINLKDGFWGVDIKPGQISYVGHLQVRDQRDGYYVELENRSSLALMFLEENFKNLLANRQIVYTGPGQDRFFEYIGKMEAGK